MQGLPALLVRPIEEQHSALRAPPLRLPACTSQCRVPYWCTLTHAAKHDLPPPPPPHWPNQTCRLPGAWTVLREGLAHLPIGNARPLCTSGLSSFSSWPPRRPQLVSETIAPLPFSSHPAPYPLAVLPLSLNQIPKLLRFMIASSYSEHV